MMGAHPMLSVCHDGRLVGRLSGEHHSDDTVQRVAVDR